MSITIQKALEAAVEKLINSDSARLDAEILLSFILNKPRSYLFTWPECELDSVIVSNYDDLINKRANGTPIAHITGKKAFWNQILNVTQESLIPRPETELLIEQALKRIPVDSSLIIADFGTGTGAIAIAIAKERPKCNLFASDIVFSNLLLARTNASLNNTSNLKFICSSWSTAIKEKSFDILLSNPPYVAASDPHLNQGDVRFESRIALISGEDGFDDIRVLINDAARILKPNGWILLEHGFDQAVQVRSMFMKSGFKNIKTYNDLNKNPRVTEAQL